MLSLQLIVFFDLLLTRAYFWFNWLNHSADLLLFLCDLVRIFSFMIISRGRREWFLLRSHCHFIGIHFLQFRWCTTIYTWASVWWNSIGSETRLNLLRLSLRFWCFHWLIKNFTFAVIGDQVFHFLLLNNKALLRLGFIRHSKRLLINISFTLVVLIVLL